VIQLVDNFMTELDYWIECLECSLEENGLSSKLTKSEIELIARDIDRGADMKSMAFGHDCIPNPIKLENERLNKELELEKSKIHCKECNGRGYITDNFLNRSSTTRCHKCNGEGRLLRKFA